MPAYSLTLAESTQVTLVTTTTDTITLPASPSGFPAVASGAAGYGVTVWNLSGATSLRVTAGALGAALDPAGPSAVVIAAGTGAQVYVTGASSASSIDVKIVGSANVYAIARTDQFLVGLAPVAPLNSFATYAVPSTLTGISNVTTVSCLGAVIGDTVSVSNSVDTLGMGYFGYVSAPGIVTVRSFNLTGGTIAPASSTLKVRVTK